ncbi:MAG: flagellar hook-basal body complex protein, partial [Pseudomonadota bacterium]|nr:flagellar hook-basal body complex protein [Pseudomonadota bacterium]
GTTQFNNNSVQNTLTQDGYTSGSLAGLEVTREGRVIRIYTNEERRDAGQIVLANFANKEGLQAIGDNAWRETNASGIGIIGTAGTGVFGTIESGVLENSNVDLAKQLVDTIVAQRAYQANSTSISTQDELLQTIINL